MKFRIINESLRSNLSQLRKIGSNFMNNMANVLDAPNLNQLQLIVGEVIEQVLDATFGYKKDIKSGDDSKLLIALRDWMTSERIRNITDSYIRAARQTKLLYPEIDLLVNFFPVGKSDNNEKLILFDKGMTPADIKIRVSAFKGYLKSDVQSWKANEGLLIVDQLRTGLKQEGFKGLDNVNKSKFLDSFIRILLAFTKENAVQIYKYLDNPGDIAYYRIFQEFYKYLNRVVKGKINESVENEMVKELKKYKIPNDKIEFYLSFGVDKVEKVLNDIYNNPEKYFKNEEVKND